MIYNLKKFNHVKLGVISENKLENRSYFIPFSDKEKCLSCDSVRERLNSDLVTVLSGKWDFKYVADTDLLTDGFNTDKEIFTSINIPSSWQEEGFGIPIYLKESKAPDGTVFYDVHHCYIHKDSYRGEHEC